MVIASPARCQVRFQRDRGELEGEVIIQTFTPHSPSVQYARKHDFDGFSEQELEFRRMLKFPPYSLLAPSARALTRHVQAVLERTSLPEDVTVVFDMDAQNFS
jgi:primosomal protein N'